MTQTRITQDKITSNPREHSHQALHVLTQHVRSYGELKKRT